MDKVSGKLASTDESQEFWEFSESESWSNHEKEVTGKLVAHEEVKGKLVASRNSEKTKNSISLQQLYLTWKKSIRS